MSNERCVAERQVNIYLTQNSSEVNYYGIVCRKSLDVTDYTDNDTIVDERIRDVEYRYRRYPGEE